MHRQRAPSERSDRRPHPLRRTVKRRDDDLSCRRCTNVTCGANLDLLSLILRFAHSFPRRTAATGLAVPAVARCPAPYPDATRKSLMSISMSRCRCCRLWTALLLMTASTSAIAQVTSQGRAQLTIEIGQASGPLRDIATEVVNGERNRAEARAKHLGFRISGGYQFDDHLSLEAGVTQGGTFTSRAPYLAADQVQAQTTFEAIDLCLIGKFPLAPVVRLNLALGAAVTGLKTRLSTMNGSALPANQENPINSKHLGGTVGADLELRLTGTFSLSAGYHAYPGVGSSHLVGSAGGTMSLLAVGVHVEF